MVKPSATSGPRKAIKAESQRGLDDKVLVLEAAPENEMHTPTQHSSEKVSPSITVAEK